MHKPFERVDAAKADVKLVGPELVDGLAKPVRYLPLFDKLALRPIVCIRCPIGEARKHDTSAHHDHSRNADPRRDPLVLIIAGTRLFRATTADIAGLRGSSP